MIIAVILFSVMTLYYSGAVVFLQRGLRRLKAPGPPQNLTYSIVIAARNEEEAIGRCLESVFCQRMPDNRYEVIVVNDRSSDGTEKVCDAYRQRYSALSVINVDTIPAGIAPKKHAVALGIARSRNEIIVLTDADCSVQSHWLTTIDRYFTGTTGLVQGITTYARPGGMNHFFFGLQALDFLSHGIVAAAAIGGGLPLNSNANNFAFRKNAFNDAGGYGSISQKAVSGDDDLLLQRIAGSGTWSVTFMADAAAAVTTQPVPTLRGVFEQRKRWGSKTVNYAPRQAMFLSGIFFFYCCIAASAAAGFFKPVFFLIFSLMLVIKIAGEYLLLIPGTTLFNQKQLRPFISPASLLQLPLVLIAVVFGVFGKFSWKGERFRRMVK
ncbi:MAG: glycosyltransferase [Chitinispirillaceae bacterium]|jgi:cellulose synthase/poly-beta-1,6-N-acetylglucosamine synthase-like glycosyltransferase